MRVACCFLLLALTSASGRAAEPAPGEARRLLAEADGAFAARRHDEALARYRAAYSAAEAEGDRAVEVEALAQVARVLSLTERREEGRLSLARAGRRADPSEPLGWTRWLGVRGIFEREDGDRARALATFEEMHAYALRHRLPLRAVDAAHHAAIVAPPEDQVAWARRGIAAAEAARSESWLAVLWNNLGATFDDLGRREDAVDAYEKARFHHYRTGGEQQRLAADWALGQALLAAGRAPEAAPFLQIALVTARRRHAETPDGESAEWVGLAEWKLGALRLAQGRADDAAVILPGARETLVAAGIADWWPAGLAALDADLAAARAAGGAR